jgi:hypothetical protein
MSLNVSALGRDMLSAFMDVLKGKAPDIRRYAEAESKKMAQSIVMIEKLVVAGTINEEEPKLHLSIQKNAARTVFLTIEGLGIIAVQEAINAALDVVKDTVNKALGFGLV